MSASPAIRLAAPARVRAVERPVALGHWVFAMVCLDAVVALVAAGAGLEVRFGGSAEAAVQGVPYSFVAAVLTPVWVGVLAAGGAYDRRFLASGADEYRRVINSGVWLTGLTVFGVFVLHVGLSRGFVGVTFPLLIATTLVERYTVRRALHRQLALGRVIHRTMVVGSHDEVRQLVDHMARVPWAGFSVIGMHSVEGEQVDVESLVEAVRDAGADTIAVAGSRPFRNGALRALSWRLEGTGIQLVVAPAVTDIAGPRIAIRPVQGLPLLMVEDPEFSGARRVIKSVLDRTGALLTLVALCPLLVLIAVLVRLSSPGPVLYRQQRVGLNSAIFTMWKFRTMQTGADREVRGVAHLNHCDNVLFKIRQDPRVTPVGRWLRRHSLDELPQLWNVIRGQMSLVGPRPPLPEEVDQYGDDVRRRLLVKPGMTGLWQVSGRAELPWRESVRLDLFYVENWSVALDLMVIWKTMGAVLHGRGAY
ncbi:MAG: sugar transferase [Chloroflexi bacterium]|nr:MAG: sugar transferase [Chloroflexota bacterium]